MWVLSEVRRGSRQVTSAREPARLATMSWAALRILASEPSMAKSLVTSSLVVMQAMVTDRSITGWMISRMARSRAVCVHSYIHSCIIE